MCRHCAKLRRHFDSFYHLIIGGIDNAPSGPATSELSEPPLSCGLPELIRTPAQTAGWALVAGRYRQYWARRSQPDVSVELPLVRKCQIEKRRRGSQTVA
jgi:hypothetical protein